MPTDTIYYLLISLVFVFVAVFYKRNYRYPYPLIIPLIVLTLAVNIVTSGTIEKVSQVFLLMLLVSITVLGKDREMVVELISQAFILSTFACAILTLANQHLLIQESYEYDFDRVMSGSLNYTCCTLGIGFVFAFREFFKASSLIRKIYYSSAMVVILTTMIIEASRGALLAIAVSSILMVLNQRIKLKTKVIIIAAIILLLLVFLNNHVLDLLIYRIQSEEGTGSGRTEIWAEKLSKFHSSMTIPKALFGIGYVETGYLGGGGIQFAGCHNDFIAFYIEYGLFGLFLFLILILYPLIVKKLKSIRADIAPLIVFIIITCLTLEPFSIGYLPFFFLLSYIYLVVAPINKVGVIV